LPKPKIRKTGGDPAAAKKNPDAAAAEPYVAATKAWDTEDPEWIVPDDPEKSDWMGVLGVDIWQNHRRPRSVTGLSSQHVLFSLCQDTYVYGRIREAQADKETILSPILIDPVVRDTLAQQAKLLQQEERKKQAAAVAPKKKAAAAAAASNKSNKATADGSDEEEEEEVAAAAAAASSSEEEDKKPAWPSLDSLLPVREALDR
jgi:hypothetical protein